MALFTDDLNNDIDGLQGRKKSLKIALILLSVVFLVVSGFLVRYYLIASQTTDALNAKVSAAVKEATSEKEKSLKASYDKKIADDAANPWQTYTAEDIFGAFSFKYPKDWRGSAIKNMSATDQFRFFADPEWFAYSVGAEGPYEALEVKVVNKKYDILLKEYENKDKKNNYKMSEIEVSSIAGQRLEWKNTETKKKAVFVILPFRDKTVYIATEKYDEVSTTYEDILKNFTINK